MTLCNCLSASGSNISLLDLPLFHFFFVMNFETLNSGVVRGKSILCSFFMEQFTSKMHSWYCCWIKLEKVRK